MEPVTAAGGVVYRQANDDDVEVILIFRRGVWDLPKGKAEEGESVRDCARREVAEEVGLDKKPEIVGELPETYHEYIRDGIEYGKTTHWFAMRAVEVNPQLSPQKSEGIEKAVWTRLQEAHRKVGYENLKTVLTNFEKSFIRAT